jgi:hypothetical protein
MSAHSNDALGSSQHTRYNANVTTRQRQGKSKQLVTRDSDIRQVLLAHLGQVYSDPEHDLIVQEFGCKKGRVDVAVINGSLHAYEIKSDSDSLERLSSQIDAYRDVFEYVTLVCGQRLLPRARTVIPKWWGLQKAECRNGEVILRELRTPKMNPSQDALALAKMLWKPEALACLRRLGHRVVTSKNTADEVSRAAADLIPISSLTDEVRQAIKARGGSGFARKSAQDDGSCTIESTAPAFHLTNLSWLLSVQSPRHLR